MEIIFQDYYTSNDEIHNLNNNYIGLYEYYKKDKNIQMYLLKYNNEIMGIIIFQIIDKLCKIYIIDIYLNSNSNYTYTKEFIYFIGEYLVNNFNKIIFCNINNKILKKIYNLVLKYNKFKIYNIDNKIINNFDKIEVNDIYIFSKNITDIRNKCCIFIL